MASFTKTVQRETCGGQNRKVVRGVSGDSRTSMAERKLLIPYNVRASHFVHSRRPHGLHRKYEADREIL